SRKFGLWRTPSSYQALPTCWLRELAQPQFHFGREEREMKVKDVMHPGVHWVEPGTSITEIARLMRDEDIGAVPVGENDRLVGMVRERDIVCRGIGECIDCWTMTAGDVMTSGIIYCQENEELDDAIRIMEQHEVRRLPVINED